MQGAASYWIQSSLDGTTWTIEATLPETLTPPATESYLVSGFAPGSVRYFSVVAVNMAGAAASLPVMASTKLPTPTGLTVTAVGQNEIDVTWAAGTSATQYLVTRSPGGAPAWPVTVTGATSYADLTVQPGTTYTYTVTA